MLLESIVVTIIKKGFGVKPSYSLKVKGDGKVVYEGFENVKVKGVVESFLEDDKVVSIISSLKDSGFFSADKDSFVFDESSSRPFTSIKVDIPSENNTNKLKIVSYYDDDTFAPLGLKNFEKKVIELTGTDKLITEHMEKKVEPVKKLIPAAVKEKKGFFSNKKFLKVTALVVCILVVLSVVYVVFITDIFDSKDSDSTDDNNNDLDNDSDDNESEIQPEIIITTTSYSERINNQRPEKKDVFYQGEKVYVDCELNNITHNNSYDFIVLINVYLDFTEYYQDTAHYMNNASDDIIYFISEIQTNESWVPEYYEIEVIINDNIENKMIMGTAFFSILGNNTELPSVSITANVTSGYAPLAVSFNCSHKNFTGNIISYTWDFGDGDTYSGLNPTYIYYTSGLYNVKLTVTDDTDASASANTYINVIKRPSPTFTANISQVPVDTWGISPYEITFTGTASGGFPPYLYEWDFDYNGSGTFTKDGEGSTVVHTFETSEYLDSFWVYLKVIDGNFTEATDDTFIWVTTS